MAGDATATQSGQTQTVGDTTAPILATIKQLESGNYSEHSHPPPGPSGAYQIIDSTWNHYGGYPRAWLAPPAVQDQFTSDKVTGVSAVYGVGAIPLYWYTGNPTHGPTWACPGSECAQFNANNGLQPGTYQKNWLAVYNKLVGQNPVFPGQGPAVSPGNPEGLPAGSSGTRAGGCDGLQLPRIDLKLFSLGGWCIGSSLIRPVIGGVSILAGGLIMLKGVSMLSKGLTDNAAVNAIQKSMAGRAQERRLFAADERVAQQRSEALDYRQQQEDIRTAASRQREEDRTTAAAQRGQVLTTQRVQRTQAQEAARQETMRQHEEQRRQTLGRSIDQQIVRKPSTRKPKKVATPT